MTTERGEVSTRPVRRSKSWRTALILLVGSISLTIFVVEVLLQIGAAIAQSRASRVILADPEADFRILFIGESTTASFEDDNPQSWPRLLQAKLQEHFASRRISIANRAVVGVDSSFLVDHIDDWLAEVQPHLVVSMVGINDDLHVLTHETQALPRGSLLNRLRTFRLLRTLVRTNTLGKFPARSSASPADPTTHSDSRRVRLERLHQSRERLLDSFAYVRLLPVLGELVEEEPGTPVYHLGLQKDVLIGYEHEHAFNRIIASVGLDDIPESVMLADLKDLLPRLREPSKNVDRWLLLRLATTEAHWRHDRDEELRLLQSAVGDEEIGTYALLRLAHFHYRFGEFAKGDEAVRRLVAEARAREEDWLLHALKFFLLYAERYALANEIEFDFRPPEEVLATRSRLYLIRRAAMSHWLAGEDEYATELFAEERQLQFKFMNARTVSNYRALADRIAAHGSLLAAVQYPTLNVDPLVATLRGTRVYTFVDNREPFISEVREKGFFAIFSDLFAGSFGHLTTEGNELLAQSVFDQLLAAGLQLSEGEAPVELAAEEEHLSSSEDDTAVDDTAVDDTAVEHDNSEGDYPLVAPEYLPFHYSLVRHGSAPESHVMVIDDSVIELDATNSKLADGIVWKIPEEFHGTSWNVAVTAEVRGDGRLAWITLTEGDAAARSAAYIANGEWHSLTATSVEFRPLTDVHITLEAENARVQFTNIRGLLYRDDRFDDVVDQTNPANFLRFQENVFRARHGRRRIGVVGNSTVAGQQLSRFHSIPFLLQMKVETEYPGAFDVVNLGRNASTLLSQNIQFFLDCNFQHYMYPGGRERSFETFTRFVRDCRKTNQQARRTSWPSLDLEFKILGSIWNDVYELNAFASDVVPLYYTADKARPLHIAYFEALFEFLARNDGAALDRFLAIDRERLPQATTPEERRVYAEEVYAYLLEAFVNHSEQERGNVMLFSLPEATGDRADLMNLFPEPHDGDFLPWNERIQTAALRRVAEERGVAYVDVVGRYHVLVHEWRLSPKAMDELGYFLAPLGVDMIHLDDRGNAFVADHLFAALRHRLSEMAGN